MDQATTKEYFEFLDDLRDSGATNMYGAGAYLRREYPELSTSESHAILGEWMRTFSDRHPA